MVFSVRGVMVQVGPPWLQETHVRALTYSTVYGPRSGLRCKLRAVGACMIACGSVGTGVAPQHDLAPSLSK